MRETPAGFATRTSIAYAPSPEALLLGRRLADDEPCPTLFRYPGPCGLADWFAGALACLAPGRLLWMSAATVTADSAGARLFGTLALLQPLRFHPVVHRRGVLVAAARPLGDDPVLWLPPSLLPAALPWDQLAAADDARAHLAAAARRERPAVVDALCRYLEELDLMRASGAPGPGVPWLALSDDERRRRLSEAGVAPVWTAPCTARVSVGKMAA